MNNAKEREDLGLHLHSVGVTESPADDSKLAIAVDVATAALMTGSWLIDLD